MSKILSSIHSDVVQLHEHGFVDSLTMRTFDALCLEPVKLYKSEEIKRLRESLNVSQPVFAAFLNVSRKAVQKWEQGEVVPNSSAMKLLSIA
ncbi:helix-turn-helix domain-containing protein, partial [Cronobacter turicensis]|nr:helix-turn-helix domain-containing protein [Cronobacter turicensis]